MFSCAKCGYQSIKRMGKCPECEAWESFSEEKEPVAQSSGIAREKIPPKPLKDVKEGNYQRIPTKIDELDRILGGGLVKGEIILVGGEPGVGKSTLLLEVAAKLSDLGKTLYVSAEESPQQVALRAQRLNLEGEKLYILGEDDLRAVAQYVQDNGYEYLVVDSVQVVFLPDTEGSKGSVNQIRASADYLTQLAKALGVVVFVVGHVTKDGAIAGPKLLEHIVDCVLYFEGEVTSGYRILRASKNRFGPTGNIAVFEMVSEGLREVKKIDELFLPHKNKPLSGSAVTCAVEGMRPLLVEVQALTTKAAFGMVRRRAIGFDFNRFSVLTAIIEKRLKINLGSEDIFLNVAGGLRLNDPAVDLAAIMAVVSSVKDKEVKNNPVLIGEVGLAGEIRRVNNINQRLKEVERANFKHCFIPESNLKEVDNSFKFIIQGYSSLKDLVEEIF